jgi:hypothetical protein
MSRITKEEVKLTLLCGERIFNSRLVADKWIRLHQKRCASCKGAERFTSEKKTITHRKTPTRNENEFAAREEQLRMNHAIFELINV